jgi:hypothetical protein
MGSDLSKLTDCKEPSDPQLAIEQNENKTGIILYEYNLFIKQHPQHPDSLPYAPILYRS